MELQGRTTLGIKIIVALSAIAILYWQDLVLIANEALNSDLSTHIIARARDNQISDLRERQILEAVKALKDQANESNIASKYKEISGEDIDIKRLHKKLVEAEEAGLIERRITNRNDEPYISWKPNF